MGNLYNLETLDVANNNLTGHLTSFWKEGLPNLLGLFLDNNFFYGEIPDFISNSSKLTVLSISSNSFSGQVPKYFFSKLNLLQKLDLYRNKFVSEISELSFIGQMKNSSHLTSVLLSENPFNGILPASVGNLSISIQYFYAYRCGLRGSIPEGFGNLENLILLNLGGNDLMGAIPNTFVNLKRLQGLGLSVNKISGSIPKYLCTLQNLDVIELNQNQITGSIPDCIGNITSLRTLYLMNNRLNFIPTSLWKLNDLLFLDLSSNLLTGFLPPDIENLKVAVFIDLSENQLSGIIPSSIQGLESVTYLNLAGNRFQGSIPESIGKLVSLYTLNLSHNNLSGNIPTSLEAIQYLKDVDVSFNGGLCGDTKYGVPPCQEKTVSVLKRKKMNLRFIFIFLGISMLVLAAALSFILARCQKKNKTETPTDISLHTAPSRVPYHELVKASEGYNESRLLGTGSYGSVYRGRLRNGEDVAVKVFNFQSEGGFKSFDTECEVLRRLRHRNLCQVIGSCSMADFKALVLEYMPNGSLEKFLYSENNFLNIVQRLKIMIDVACALEYLHHGYSIPIVHCDLKPGNVLLDDDMVAHLSDFGIAKLLSEGVSFTLTETPATLGYIAPEYGSQGLVSVGCDVYSYGIMLMEVFTRTKPNDAKFYGELSLRRWVNNSVSNAIVQVIDSELLSSDEIYFEEKLECLVWIMEIALQCSVENPNERIINIKSVVVELNKIMYQLLDILHE